MKRILLSMLICSLLVAVTIDAGPTDISKDSSKVSSQSVISTPSSKIACHDIGGGFVECTETKYGGVIAYINETTKRYEEIDTTIRPSYGLWDYGVETGAYRAYFKEDPSTSETVMYNKTQTVSYQPMFLIYRGDISQEQIATVYEQYTLGYPSGNEFIYEDLFLHGTDLKYVYQENMLKELYIIESFKMLPEPQAWVGGNVYLEMHHLLSYDADTKMFINDVEYDKKSNVFTNEKIEFTDSLDNEIFFLPEPVAYDSAGETIRLKWSIIYSNKKSYIYWQVPYSWLSSNDRVYPVYIDPTTQLWDADTDIMTDIEFGKGGATSQYFENFSLQFMVNITSLPIHINITDSQFCMNHAFTSGSGGDDDVNVSRVNNHTWTETVTNVSLLAMGVTNSTLRNFTTSGDFWCVNSTEMAQTDYTGSFKNTSLRLEDPDYQTTTIDTVNEGGANQYLSFGNNSAGENFYAKSSPNAALVPYMNITYIYQPYPYWSLNASTTPDYNISSEYLFNISWDVPNGMVDTVYIESNWSGSATNYTMTNTTYGTDIYNYTMTSIPAGDYYWKSYCNSTVGFINVSDTWQFTVAKSSTTTDIELNGTENSDRSYLQSDSWNITGYAVDTALNVTIYIDSVLSGYGLGSAVNISGSGTLGDINVTVYTEANENYTGSSRELTITIVSAGTPTYSDIQEEYASPVTYSYSKDSQMFNITWEWNATLSNLSAVTLDFNGTNITVTGNRSIGYGNAEFYYNLTPSLAAGSYSYTWYANNSVGNMGNTPSYDYTVNQATPSVSLSTTSWTVYVNDPVTVEGEETNDGDTDCSYVLKMDGSVKTNPYSVTFGSTAIHTFNYTVSGCENYSDSYTYHDLSVIAALSGSSGTGTETVIIVGDNNWSIVRPDLLFIMSPGSYITRTIQIDNQMDEDITIDDIKLECIPAACAPEYCTDICKYIVFGNEVYSSGVVGRIPPGQTGEINFTIDLREQYVGMMALEEVPLGTHTFSFSVEIEGIKNSASGSVTVGEGLNQIGEALDWLTGFTVLFLGENQILIPNWLIASGGIIVSMLGILGLIKWIRRGKPKKRFRDYDIFR